MAVTFVQFFFHPFFPNRSRGQVIIALSWEVLSPSSRGKRPSSSMIAAKRKNWPWGNPYEIIFSRYVRVTFRAVFPKRKHRQFWNDIASSFLAGISNIDLISTQYSLNAKLLWIDHWSTSHKSMNPFSCHFEEYLRNLSLLSFPSFLFSNSSFLCRLAKKAIFSFLNLLQKSLKY